MPPWVPDINFPDFYWAAAYRSSWGMRDLVHGSDRKLHTHGAANQRLQCGGHDTAWGLAARSSEAKSTKAPYPLNDGAVARVRGIK